MTQGQVAVSLARRLGLGEKLSEQRAIDLLTAARVVPDAGWTASGPANDIFLVQIQKTALLALADVAKELRIPAPPTLRLVIQTPGDMGGQFYDRREPGAGTSTLLADAETRLSQAPPAAVTIESPHPYPAGDDQVPVTWSYRLRVPSAKALRIHFSRGELSDGDSVRVLDRYGRERWKSPGQRFGDVWTPAIESDTAIIVIRAGTSTPAWGIAVDQYGSISR